MGLNRYNTYCLYLKNIIVIYLRLYLKYLFTLQDSTWHPLVNVEFFIHNAAVNCVWKKCFRKYIYVYTRFFVVYKYIHLKSLSFKISVIIFKTLKYVNLKTKTTLWTYTTIRVFYLVLSVWFLVFRVDNNNLRQYFNLK